MESGISREVDGHHIDILLHVHQYIPTFHHCWKRMGINFSWRAHTRHGAEYCQRRLRYEYNDYTWFVCFSYYSCVGNSAQSVCNNYNWNASKISTSQRDNL